MTGTSEPAVGAVVAAVKSQEQVSSGTSERTAADVSSIWLAVIAPAMALLALLDLYLLVQFWPASAGAGEVPPKFQDVAVFGATFAQVPRETLFFAVVILSGALGGFVHSLRSLAWYVGAQRFFRSWVLNYLYLPLVGALTAVILYLIIRAGFLAGTSAEATSPFGFAALGAMSGLFTEQGVKKLKEVFETLLTKADEGPHSKDAPISDNGSA